ncbi:BTB/POZ domain-containing protein kctd15-like [Watersipora subatra]|uniref:BTB/POZ domain-containing protein kctd15-like n=1 Tax=Watersipora subatra TaxID=2589382 RepID=UPI00355C17DC
MGTKTEIDEDVSHSYCNPQGAQAQGRMRRRKRVAPYSSPKIVGQESDHFYRQQWIETVQEAVHPYGRIDGIPQPAPPSRLSAPVHIDIGGTIYTSTLQTLTKYKESRLAKLFAGTLPITLDTLKQHYFIDRDGESFRHILNFLRHDELILPSNYKELDILLREAVYYEIVPLVEKIKSWRQSEQTVHQKSREQTALQDKMRIEQHTSSPKAN